jgi:hypothetical protein
MWSIVDWNIDLQHILVYAHNTHTHTHTQRNITGHIIIRDNFFQPGDVQPVTTPRMYQHTQSSGTWLHKVCIFGQKILSYPSISVGLAVYFKDSTGICQWLKVCYTEKPGNRNLLHSAERKSVTDDKQATEWTQRKMDISDRNSFTTIRTHYAIMSKNFQNSDQPCGLVVSVSDY